MKVFHWFFLSTYFLSLVFGFYPEYVLIDGIDEIFEFGMIGKRLLYFSRKFHKIEIFGLNNIHVANGQSLTYPLLMT